jgi:hypothetical protein
MAAFEMSAENRKSRENNKRNKRDPTKSIQHRVTGAFDRVGFGSFSQIAPPAVGSVRSGKTTPASAEQARLPTLQIEVERNRL